MLAEQRGFDLGTWAGVRGWLDALALDHERRGFAGGCPLGSIVAEVADHDERLRTLAAEAFARSERELAASLESLKERGGLRPEADPAVLSEEVLAAIQGKYLLSTVKRDARPMRAALGVAYARLRSYSA